MTPFVKICGLTSAEAVDAAVQAGANAVGFVFHKTSPRALSLSVGAQLSISVPTSVQKVIVAKSLTSVEWEDILNALKPDALQLDADAMVRLNVPNSINRWPVYREPHEPHDWPNQIVWEGHDSGVGQVVDWAHAARVARRTRVLLAGGLTPDNVRSAISQVTPYGVDVSSGVESAPGVKSVEKIKEFVRNAQAEFIEIE
jgi:phosphoribosylanthranilate isomerase